MSDSLEEARQHFLQGVAHFEADRLAEARQSFQHSLALAPGRPSVLANLGVTLFRLGLWQDAVPVLGEAAAADSGNRDVRIALGLSCQALKQWPQAIESLSQVLAAMPERADLWLELARCQAQFGALLPALQAYDRVLSSSPDLVVAWSECGGLLRELGRFDEAAVYFEKALSLGADPELHQFYLASVRGSDSPSPPPRWYVEGLFDSYAADFQTHLVGELKYQGHRTLMEPLLKSGRRYDLVLDLGCGTGLCGQLIHPIAATIDGVDVSRAMLDEAAKHGIYRHLCHADLESFLASAEPYADLVIAADVFIYVGDLAATFDAVRRVLLPGGLFAFTVELSPEGKDIALLPTLRHAHSASYIRNLARRSGFRLVDLFAAPIRYDQSKPIQGLYVYLG